MARTHRKDDTEMAQFKAKKFARSLIRLKYSIMAEEELNQVIPDIDEAVQDALLTGEDWRFDVKALIAGLES